MPYDRVLKTFANMVPEISKRRRGTGPVFTHGTNRGRPFDFAILETRKTVPFVRLTRFRFQTKPRQRIGDTKEAVRMAIMTTSDLDLIRWLAEYSLRLRKWKLVDTSDDPLKLAKSFGYHFKDAESGQPLGSAPTEFE